MPHSSIIPQIPSFMSAVGQDSKFTSMLVAAGHPGIAISDAPLALAYSNSYNSATSSSFTSYPDLFAPDAELEPARQSMWSFIESFPDYTWALVTRYPENIMKMLPSHGIWRDEQHRLPANLWLGVMVTTQAEAEVRIPELLRIPVQTRFVSHLGMTTAIPYPLNGTTRYEVFQDGEDMLQCATCGAGVWESECGCSNCHTPRTKEWVAKDMIHFVQLPDPMVPAAGSHYVEQLRRDYSRANISIFGQRASIEAAAVHA